MAISESERQAFAQALRDLADGNGGELLDRVNRLRVDEVGDYTLFGVGAVLAMDKAGSCDADDASGYLTALADLIDRPTCRSLSPKPADVLLCSECGEHVDIAHVENCDDYHARFCPNCGAEVKNEVD